MSSRRGKTPFPCTCQGAVRGPASQGPNLLSLATELGHIVRDEIQRTEIHDGYLGNVFNGQEQQALSRSRPTQISAVISLMQGSKVA